MQKISSKVHFHARNLMLQVTAPPKVQISLRPLYTLRWIPDCNLTDRDTHPIDPELLRDLYLFLYRVCPANKVAWIHMMYPRYLLELLTPTEQTQLVQVLKEWYE